MRIVTTLALCAALCAALVGIHPGAAQPAGPPAVAEATEAQAAAKYDAELDAYNELVADHDLVDDLATYLARSRRWLPPGTTAGSGDSFFFGFRSFAETIKRLGAATALPGAVPDLDPAASRLLAALQASNPLVLDLGRYEAGRGYVDDGLAHARAQHGPFVAAMRTVNAAADGLQAALSDHAVALERRQVARLPQGSLRQSIAGDGLDLREVERLLRTLKAGDDVTALEAALARFSADTNRMHAALDALTPAADYNCGDYAGKTDVLLGYGRDQARAAKAGADPKRPIDEFRDIYPITMDSLQKCLAAETRAQP